MSRLFDDPIGNAAVIRERLDERFHAAVQLGKLESEHRIDFERMRGLHEKLAKVERLMNGGKLAQWRGRRKAEDLGKRADEALARGRRRQDEIDKLSTRVARIDIELMGIAEATAMRTGTKLPQNTARTPA